MGSEWVYNGSGRSVLIAALLHAVFNSALDSKFAPEFFPNSAAMAIPLAAVVVLGVLVTGLTRGRLAYEREHGAIGERSAA